MGKHQTRRRHVQGLVGGLAQAAIPPVINAAVGRARLACRATISSTPASLSARRAVQSPPLCRGPSHDEILGFLLTAARSDITTLESVSPRRGDVHGRQVVSGAREFNRPNHRTT